MLYSDGNRRLKQITHIFFDVDGTLYDKNREYVPGNGTIMDAHDFFRYRAFIAGRSGARLEDVAGKIMQEYADLARGRHLKSWISQVPSEIKEEYRELLQTYGANGWLLAEEFGVEKGYLASLLENMDFCSLLSPDEDLIRTVVDLKRRFHLGIITNETYKTTVTVIGALGLSLDDLAGDTGTKYPVFCRETGVSKPDPYSFQHTIDVLGISPGPCMYVGDSIEKDILPSKKVGLFPVLIDHGSEKKMCDGYLQIGYLSDLTTVYEGGIR